MGSRKQHEDECLLKLGHKYSHVHRFLDHHFSKQGPRHRHILHHQQGIDEVIKKFGYDAGEAAKLHILMDCGRIPDKKEYHNRTCDFMGINDESLFLPIKHIDLSVDFDFFVREDLIWDWGHRETTLFLNDIWTIRSDSMDLVSETDIKRFADFDPICILKVLRDHGIYFNSQDMHLYLSESHLAMLAPQMRKSNKQLIVLDAHLDLFPDKEKPDCGNWMRKYIIDNGITYTLVLMPQWLDYLPEVNEDDRMMNVHVERWSDLGRLNLVIDNLFLCRSGCWVPPHHDETIKLVSNILQMNAKDSFIIGELDITEPRKYTYCIRGDNDQRRN